MKVLEKNKAIELRKQGQTYIEIQKRLPVSKSSLSYWLRDIKLNEEQLRRIYQKNLEIRRKFIEYNQFKRKQAIARKNYISRLAQREIKNISRRELKLVGTALYWAEGSKSNNWGTLAFANSDPGMVVLMMRWFREICKVPEEKFRLKVQAYGKLKIKKHEEFWSKLTGIPLSQFIKPYVKKSKYSKLRRGNTLPYGTLHIRVSDTKLLAKIKGWIKGIEAPWSSPA